MIEAGAAIGGADRPTAEKIALIGTYPPQKCGIASFTEDMRAAFHVADPLVRTTVCSIRAPGPAANYGDAVRVIVDRNEMGDYARAAASLNARGVTTISLQHEFGIFGGVAGDFILRLLDKTSASLVTTLHTISPRLAADQRRVLAELLDRSDRVVTMARKGRDILIDSYGADPARIAIIPHGVPARSAADKDLTKAALGLAGRTVLMTFGLLGRGKGLETMIRAMPAIAARHKGCIYVIVGATHPAILASEGEAYREMLTSLATELGVADHVAFINRYVPLDELVDCLSAADIYVTPYLNEAQITSGTLSYAYALGRPVISTPYWHAAEMLANGRGVLCPFADSAAFAGAAKELLADPARLKAMSARAIVDGAAMRWPAVGRRYLQLFAAVRRRAPAAALSFASTPLLKDRRHDAISPLAARVVARLS